MSVKGQSASDVTERLEGGRDKMAEKTGTAAVANKYEAKGKEIGRTIRSGQLTSKFTMMVQAAVTLAVGVLVVGSIFNALPAIDGPMSSAANQTEQLTGTAFELAPIVLIVIVASLVLGIIRGL